LITDTAEYLKDNPKAAGILQSAQISSLPFDADQQSGVLGHVIDFQKDEIFLQIKDKIKAEWFADAYSARLYKYYLDFYEKYGHIPASRTEFQGFYANVDLGEKVRIDNALTLSEQRRHLFSPDVMMADLTHWMRFVVLLNAGQESADRFNKKNLTGAAYGESGVPFKPLAAYGFCFQYPPLTVVKHLQTVESKWATID